MEKEVSLILYNNDVLVMTCSGWGRVEWVLYSVCEARGNNLSMNYAESSPSCHLLSLLSSSSKSGATPACVTAPRSELYSESVY